MTTKMNLHGKSTTSNHLRLRVLVRLLCLAFVFLSVALSGCNSGDNSRSASDSATAWAVDAGALKLRVTKSPWHMTFYDADGGVVLAENEGTGSAPTGTLGFYPGPPP